MTSSSNTIKRLLLIVAAMTTLAGAGTIQAQTTLLTYFNFNDNTSGSDPATNPGLISDFGQPTTIATNFGTADVQNNSTGSSINKITGDLNGSALKLVAGTSQVENGNYIQFSVATTGFQSLALSYAALRTSTGFTTQTLSYSTNGTDFTNTGLSFSPTTSYSLAAFDLGAITAINNSADVTFRLTFTGASGSTGQNSLDNIQVTGVTAVPEPSTTAAGLLTIGALCWYQRRRFQILARSLFA